MVVRPDAKDGLQRMLVQVPLTDEERAAVEGDQTAVERLITNLAGTPPPASPRSGRRPSDVRADRFQPIRGDRQWLLIGLMTRLCGVGEQCGRSLRRRIASESWSGWVREPAPIVLPAMLAGVVADGTRKRLMAHAILDGR